MRKTSIVLMGIGFLSSIFGFVRYITLGNYYGASFISDAYLISLTIPLTIFQFIGRGISTTFIPIYSKMQSEKTDKDVKHFINNLINVLMLFTMLIIISLIIFMPYIVRLFASGFTGETFKLAVSLTRITVLGIMFSVLMSVLRGYLHANHAFFAPSLTGLPFNLIIITATIISSKTSIIVLAIGTLIAMFSEFVVIVYFAYKIGYNYKIVLKYNDKNLIKMLQLSVPIILGTSIDQVNRIVDRTLASQITIGGISALVYANRLNLFAQNIFVSSISTVMYPLISKQAAENNIYGLKKTVSESINAINLLLIPVTLGTIIFTEEIVNMLFGRGEFGIEAVSLTSYALVFYSIGMIGVGLREVLSRVFYSLQDTKTPMINAAIAMVINITLNIILSKYLGVGGLALATSISAIICTVLLIISLRKKIGAFGLKSIIVTFIKISVAGIIMSLSAKYIFITLENFISLNVTLIISIIFGALIYFVQMYFMKIKEVDVLLMAIKSKLNRN